jgi:iron complex transport system substrate-binding protein
VGAAKSFTRRPKVYFEEWDEPMISGIRWVSELVEIAGGEDIFKEKSFSQDAKGRVVADPGEVLKRKPDVIIGSWCGKKFRPERVAARPGWDEIPAVKNNQLHEVKSSEILQPGPAALTDGVRRIHAVLSTWAKA